MLAVVLGGALSLSSIALAMRGALGLRHRIKSVDRLLGNTVLEQSRLHIYGSRARLQMLLLIAHLASFVQRLIGEDAKARQLELQFSPANRTARHQISVLTLAKRILAAPSYWLNQLTPWAAIPPLTEQARLAWTSS